MLPWLICVSVEWRWSLRPPPTVIQSSPAAPACSSVGVNAGAGVIAVELAPVVAVVTSAASAATSATGTSKRNKRIFPLLQTVDDRRAPGAARAECYAA